MPSLIALTVGLVVALLTVPLSIWLAGRLGMLDVPDSRKIHTVPTPRLGGIAIFLGVFLGSVGAIGYAFVRGEGLEPATVAKITAILTAGLFIFVVGLVDDIRSVSSRFKLVALVTTAATVCGSGVLLDGFNFGGQSMVEFAWVSWLATIFWIIYVSVAINFIDGLDGLAGGVVMLAAATLGGFLIATGHSPLAIMPLSLTGALLGFLVYNRHPAQTFMGDSGSLTIGFILASTMVMANPVIGSMKSLVVPSLAISIPLIDTVLTLFRRHYQQRRSLFSAERGHIHHRMLDRGLSHRHAVILLHAVSLAAVGIGLIADAFEGWGTFGGLALMVPLLWGVFQFAGSVRTNEMIRALRTKRDYDRVKKHYRTTFEALQLDFHHVGTFGQWWEGTCRAAERLDFIQVRLTLPTATGADRELLWQTSNTELALRGEMRATIPVESGDATDNQYRLTVDIAGNRCLESASERLGLFSRLMTENSLNNIRQRERRRMQRSKAMALSGQLPLHEADLLGQPLAGPFAGLRVAIVHDFFYTYCGAERVVEQLLHLFPHADVHALFDFLPESQRAFLQGKTVHTSFIQRLPFARRKHRAYLPLMPLAIEQLDMSDYDLVVSSSYLAAKGVITGPDQLHVCYCHSPVRYAWDLHHHYLDRAGLGYGIRGMLARMILHYIRSWDVRTSLGVDHFIANSEFVARRIKKVYRRHATVVHPPVDTQQFHPLDTSREDFYLVAGRLVPYKRTDLVVSAFREMPDRRLIVVGDGPELDAIRDSAPENVQFVGFQPEAAMVDLMRRAQALLFAAEEDFGIVPVEALACGTPVIAYGKGGVTETVIDGVHGVHFEEQTEASLIDAIDRFESQRDFGKFDPVILRRRALNFSVAEFIDSMTLCVHRWAKGRWPERSLATCPPSQLRRPHSSHAQTAPDPLVLDDSDLGPQVAVGN